MKLSFTKMHGLGNDFIVINDMQLSPGLDIAPEQARALCHRRTGIGADGVILVRPSDACTLRMTLFNSDGSEAEMCGNGIRCFAKYAYDTKLISADTLSVETPAGVMRIKLTVQNGLATAAAVDMGVPCLKRADIPMTGDPDADCLEQRMTVDGREYVYSSILLGVPHTVVYVDDIAHTDIARIGPIIEHLPQYPRLTNVNFAQVLDDRTALVRTWERGCGATLACGTGSSSVAVCCAAAGRTGRQVEIRLALGSLYIDWRQDGHVIMTGPAAYSFTGETEI